MTLVPLQVLIDFVVPMWTKAWTCLYHSCLKLLLEIRDILFGTSESRVQLNALSGLGKLD